MFQKILVPVDFSEHAKSAFAYGALFASRFAGRIELAHVVEDVVTSHPPFWTGEKALAEELQQQALLGAKRSMKKLLPTLPVPAGTEIDTRILSGPLPLALAEHAKESKTELIVIATHGRTGFSRWLMGSVSERLLRSAPCPVLVARGSVAQGSVAVAQPQIGRVLVAVDLSEHSRRALHVAGLIAQGFGASLEVLYVWAAPFYDPESQQHAGLFERVRQSARDELDEFIGRAQLPASVALERTIVSGTATAKISDRVHETTPDLLVLGTHGHGGFKRMVLGSVAEATARYTSCATLVVP